MSVVKVTEITASSKKSFKDAIEEGIQRASTTVRNMKGAWIQEQSVTIKDGQVDEYRVNMKISFVLD